VTTEPYGGRLARAVRLREDGLGSTLRAIDHYAADLDRSRLR
jgi:hypothetical protein